MPRRMADKEDRVFDGEQEGFFRCAEYTYRKIPRLGQLSIPGPEGNAIHRAACAYLGTTYLLSFGPKVRATASALQ